MVRVVSVPIPGDILRYGEDKIIPMRANSKILYGTAVGMIATGVDWSCSPYSPENGMQPIGIALKPGVAGDIIPVATTGAVVKVTLADQTTPVAAGEELAATRGNLDCLGGLVLCGGVDEGASVSPGGYSPNQADHNSMPAATIIAIAMTDNSSSFQIFALVRPQRYQSGI